MPRSGSWIFRIIAMLLFLGFLAMAQLQMHFLDFQGKAADSYPKDWPGGARNGRLAPCKGTPNCVSSQSPGTPFFIDPIPAGQKDTMERLSEVIRKMPGARIVERSREYLRATFRSRFFGFVDDVEFLFDEKNKVIHFRSASRLGSSDFGVNRKRMEEIRSLFTSKP